MIRYWGEVYSDSANASFQSRVDIMGNNYGLIWKLYYGMGVTNYDSYFSNLGDPTD